MSHVRAINQSIIENFFLPVLIATSPFPRSRSDCWVMKFDAPLNLKEPAFCRFSHLRKNRILRSDEDAALEIGSDRNKGVRLMSGLMVSCATRIPAIDGFDKVICSNCTLFHLCFKLRRGMISNV